VQGLVLAREGEIGLEARHLPPVGVSLDLEVDEAQMPPIEHDHAGARAEDGPLELPDRRFEPVEAHEPQNRRRLAARNDEAVQAGELLREADLHDVGAERAQYTGVLAEGALDGEYTDAGTLRHDANSRNSGASDPLRCPTAVIEHEGRDVKRASIALACLLALVATASALAQKPSSNRSTGGAGRVFFPNPVAQLQDKSLTDEKDSDYAALQPAYREVALTNLDGSGYLVGDWANIRSVTGSQAFSPTNTFLYNRHDDEFEQVMAYYWVTEAQKYIQSLGFGSTLRPINKESQDIRINQYGQDNSFSRDTKDQLTFGKGGVDDAEDAEVILHEYGHAMQDSQQTPFGFGATVEAGSIGEGFADYWAVTVSNLTAPTPDAPCVADWDSVSYTSETPHCLRRVDEDLTYRDDLDGRVHHDGQIWSRALWDIRQALDHTKADTIILEAQFDMKEPTMPELAQKTVDTAQRLYGNSARNAVLGAFRARGILS